MNLVYQTEDGTTNAIPITNTTRAQALIDSGKDFKIKGQPVRLIQLCTDDEWSRLQILITKQTNNYEIWKKTGAYMRRYHRFPTKEQLDNFIE